MIGTGKTYIGLRIVEVLLANTTEWPILIVCHTNHALDQFLEGILKFCNGKELIRIGGKSQSPALENHQLNAVKSNSPESKRIVGAADNRYQHMLKQYKSNIDMYKVEIMIL